MLQSCFVIDLYFNVDFNTVPNYRKCNCHYIQLPAYTEILIQIYAKMIVGGGINCLLVVHLRKGTTCLNINIHLTISKVEFRYIQIYLLISLDEILMNEHI